MIRSYTYGILLLILIACLLSALAFSAAVMAQVQPDADTSRTDSTEGAVSADSAVETIKPFSQATATPGLGQSDSTPVPVDAAFEEWKVAPEEIRECLVTNVFYDSDVREILQTMAAQCFVNIIADNSASGIVTIELTDLPLEEALRRVLFPLGLTFRWMDGYYLVGAPRPDNPSFPSLTESELYRPNFINATDVLKLMSSHYEPFISVNDQTNTLLLTASPELLARIKTDLAEIDRPPRQVMIEALVTEVSSDVNRQLGISWSGEGSSDYDRGSFRIDAYPKARGDSAFIADPDMFTTFFERVGVWSGTWVGSFRAQLEALVQKGEARIRANPRIAVLEGKQARIFIGREEYFSILTGSVTYAYARLEVIKTGISLTITPYVSQDGYITLKVEPEVSDVIGSGSGGLPVTNKRSVITTVRVAEGETAVIGGLTVEYDQKIVRKVPLLGSIPILGHLFRHVDSEMNESEITVLITPHLWQPPGEVKDN